MPNGDYTDFDNMLHFYKCENKLEIDWRIIAFDKEYPTPIIIAGPTSIDNKLSLHTDMLKLFKNMNYNIIPLEVTK